MSTNLDGFNRNYQESRSDSVRNILPTNPGLMNKYPIKLVIPVIVPFVLDVFDNSGENISTG